MTTIQHRPVRVAVIGYGMSGKGFHAYLAKETPGMELYGIASRDAATRDRITAEQGCRAYADIDAVIADPAVDLIVLATPNATHAELAIRALNASKHVVTDKVMCLSLHDCDQMIAAAKNTGKMLSVFQNRRFDGDYLTVRKLLDEGCLGDVRWIEMAWQGFGAWGGWRGDAAMGGGKYLDLGAHLVDQLCMLFPQRIESVYCRKHFDFTETDTESEALLVVTFAGGGTGVCDFSSMAAIRKPRFYVKGSRGTFQKFGLDPQEAAMMAGDIDAAVESPDFYGKLSDGKQDTVIPTISGRWRNYYENIVAVLCSGAEPLVRLDEVRREIAVLDAGIRSARENRVVFCDE